MLELLLPLLGVCFAEFAICYLFLARDARVRAKGGPQADPLRQKMHII